MATESKYAEYSVYFPDDDHRLVMSRENAEKVIESHKPHRKLELHIRVVSSWRSIGE